MMIEQDYDQEANSAGEPILREPFLVEIETFLAVAKTGSYSDAIDVLFHQNHRGRGAGGRLTATAVQARIKKLESHLTNGDPLFTRALLNVPIDALRTGERKRQRPTRLVPTVTGSRFLKYASLIEKLWERAIDDVSRFQAYSGMIVIGSQFSLLDHIARRFLSAMRERHGDVAVSFKVYKSDELIRGLRENTMDISLVYDESDRSGLVSQPFADEILVLVSKTPYQSYREIKRQDYIYIDYGASFSEWHQRKYHKDDEVARPSAHFDRAGPALRYIRENTNAAGYVPFRMALRYLGEGLHIVPNAKAKKRKIYLVYREEEPVVDIRRVNSVGDAEDVTNYVWRDAQYKKAIIREARLILEDISKTLEAEWTATLKQYDFLEAMSE